MSLRRFNTTTVFLVPQCLADDLKFGTQNSEFILIRWNHAWMLSGNTASKCFVFVIFLFNFISIFLVAVLKGPKEIVKASVQECLDKKGQK